MVINILGHNSWPAHYDIKPVEDKNLIIVQYFDHQESTENRYKLEKIINM